MRSLMRSLLAFSILAATGSAQNSDDSKGIQGKWTIVQIQIGGRDTISPKKKDSSPNRTAVFNGDRLFFDGELFGSFSLDQTKEPRHINSILLKNQKETPIAGIYKLEKDTLLICWSGGADRPKEFKTTRERSDFRLLTLKRIPDQEKNEPPKEFTNGIGMKFVWIPPGSFIMGSPKDEEGRNKWETPRKVALTKGFYLGIYEVTQEEWKTVMGNNPSLGTKSEQRPVSGVSWNDCQAFLEKMGKKDGRSYRLPTEAEWEYACRAGSKGPYCCDNAADLPKYAWYQPHAKGKVHPVGLKWPNAWGLYDMHGNVAEWCSEYLADYPNSDVVDPVNVPPDSQSGNRATRGGTFVNSPRELRSAARNGNTFRMTVGSLGLRAVMNPPTDK